MNGIQKTMRDNLGYDIHDGFLVLRGLDYKHPHNGDMKLYIDDDGDLVKTSFNGSGWLTDSLGGFTKNSLSVNSYYSKGASDAAGMDNTYLFNSIALGENLTFINDTSIQMKDVSLVTYYSDLIFKSIGGANLVLQNTDFEAETIGKGFVLSSPDGTRYRIEVDNSGALSTSVV